MPIKLTDLQDFISAADECIIPVEIPPSSSGGVILRSTRSKLSERRGRDQKAASPQAKESVKLRVSLQDCLTCAGCVSSAESVFVETQNTDAFLECLRDTSKPAHVSISHPIIVAFAFKYELASLQESYVLIVNWLRSIRPDVQIDSTSIGQLKARQRAASRFIDLSLRESAEKRSTVFTSSCPATVLYAEKVHHELLPYFDFVPSPLAHHVKMLSSQVTVPVNLVAFEPCFDRKLESLRPELKSELVNTLVVAPSELYGLVDDFIASRTQMDDELDFDGFNAVDWESPSGGYIEEILGCLQKSEDLTVSIGEWCRKSDNLDVIDVTVNGVVYKFARCYSYKNLQNLARRIRRQQFEYAFVELFACSNGCVNGSAQGIRIIPNYQSKVEDFGKNLADDSILAKANMHDVDSDFDLEIRKSEDPEKKGGIALSELNEF